jgi:RsiW-degrading membrane proteinase PrsW (M82 family)
MPLVYALLAMAVFGGIAWWVFEIDESEDRHETLRRLVSGAVSGLFIVFAISSLTSKAGLAGTLFGLPGLIGFSAIGLGDRLKDSDLVPLWVNIVGYTLSVGLVEEFAKAFCARVNDIDGQQRLAHGFAAGLGFGLAEAILYSWRMYDGVEPWATYTVRFAFCVPFHAFMSAIAVQCLPEDWTSRWGRSLLGLIPIATLHGAYDALLSRDHPTAAGLIATFTFLLLPAVVWYREEIRGEL